MLRFSMLFIALLLALGAPANAQNAPRLPEHLTFGYAGEGAVDTSPAACLAFVQEVTLWDEAETKKAAHEVCAARKRHADAYAAIQKSYRALARYIEQDSRLNAAASIMSFKAMVKDCIDHKAYINTGGHNIRIDIIPNHVVAECLKLGKGLLDSETAWFEEGGASDERPAP